LGRSGYAGLRMTLARVGTSMAFEVFDFAFVLFGGGAGFEGAEVAAFAGVGVFLAGVEAELAGGEFADHEGDLLSKDWSVHSEIVGARWYRITCVCEPRADPGVEARDGGSTRATFNCF